MNTSQKAVVLMVAGGMVLLSVLAIAHEEIKEKTGIQATPAKEVLVRTDRQEYKQGEIIRVTIENRLEASIFCQVGVEGIKHVERRTPEGSWEQFFSTCKYPHCIYRLAAPQGMSPGESRAFEWKPLIHINGTRKTRGLGPGQYRISILYQVTEQKESESVYSNLFVIEGP